MTFQYPLHPDDEKQLLRIRRYLIGYRITNGWTQPQLSQMINGTAGTVWNLESDTSWQWRFSRLQGWPVPFGLRLTAVVRLPSKRVHAHVHAHPEVTPALSLSQGERDPQLWQRIYLTSTLVVARRHLGISTAEIAKRLGITRKAVSNWENVADDLLLCRVLHNARMLGCHIELGLSDD